jgi:hypothetical protein
LLKADEECDSRILNKSKTDESDMVDVDEDRSDNEEESGDVVEEKVEKRTGSSEYALRRERNIEENKKKLAQLKMKIPIRDLIEKANKIVTSDSDATPALPTSSNTTSSPVSNNNLANGSHVNSFLQPANETPQPTIQVPSAETGEQGEPATSNDTAHGEDTAHAAIFSLANNFIQPSIETAQPEVDSLGNSSLLPVNETHSRFDTTIPTCLPPPQVNTENYSNVSKSGDNEVVMDDESSEVSTSPEEGLPPWLVPMIGYLRGLTEDVAWQNLVTTFITFERQHPPNGVSSLFFLFSHS